MSRLTCLGVLSKYFGGRASSAARNVFQHAFNFVSLSKSSVRNPTSVPNFAATYIILRTTIKNTPVHVELHKMDAPIYHSKHVVQ